jgi:hypothetical protein
MARRDCGFVVQLGLLTDVLKCGVDRFDRPFVAAPKKRVIMEHYARLWGRPVAPGATTRLRAQKIDRQNPF